MNAPFYVYVSRWFDRRRGSALALISSGSYLAGAIWPSMFERAITYAGWRQTMFYYGLLEVILVVPLAAIFLRQPPELALPEGAFGTSPAPKTVMGWPPNLVFGLVAAAVIFCCIPMAMPQAHLPALCSDLGILASHGAAMVRRSISNSRSRPAVAAAAFISFSTFPLPMKGSILPCARH